MKKDHGEAHLHAARIGGEARAFIAAVAVLAAVAASMMPMRHEPITTLEHRPRSFVAGSFQHVEWEGREVNNVILVVIDGARAQEVFDGTDQVIAAQRRFSDLSHFRTGARLMPELHAWLQDEGTALGAPSDPQGVFASGPNYVSMPGYLEILTGHAQPGCQDNDCGAVREKTILDEARERAGARDAVAAFASWPALGRAVAKSPGAMVVSAGVGFPFGWLELQKAPELLALWASGRPRESYPGDTGYRIDAYTARLGLRYVDERRPRLTFIALGDTDEYAHKDDYRGYIKALRSADATLGALRNVLQASGDWGRRTTVLVTSDHGRGHDFRDHGGAFPESARSFVIALGGLAKHNGIATGLAPHRLADIAPTIRHVMRLPPRDLSPQPGVILAEAIVSDEDNTMASQ
jgi:hypothetical protein